MTKHLTARQMLNNELAVRAINKKSAKALKHHIPRPEQDNLKIAFNCECADPECQERILLTLKDYEKTHRNFARFIVIKDHFEPKVEKVHKTAGRLSIVEKNALS